MEHQRAIPAQDMDLLLDAVGSWNPMEIVQSVRDHRTRYLQAQSIQRRVRDHLLGGHYL
jgi:hypothetical protein